MFRSRARNRKIFGRRKRVRRFSWLSAIASIALFLILLELVTRIFVDISGDRSRFAGLSESEPIEAYKLNVVASDRSASSSDVAQETVTEANREELQFLQIENSIYTGYELVGNQDSQYWQINAQGFRDREPIPLAKPKDEVRIFLLGGSTAFGYGSSSNAATISAQLEQRLQKRLQQQKASPQLYRPDFLPANPEERQNAGKPAKIKPGNYRVINAAVPGYASGNELARVALEILKYKPDLIIVLDGYVDLMLPGDKKAVQISQLQQNNNESDNLAKLDRFVAPLKDSSYLIQAVQNTWSNSQKTDSKADFILDEKIFNLVEHLPGGEQELENRVARYIEHHKQILDLSAAAQIPLIVAIQPEITGRNATQLSDFEGEIATQLGRSYIRQVRDSYPAFIEAIQQLANAFPKNIKALDLYRLTDKYPSPSFIDPIHLNEAANEKLAEQLYYAISSFPKMQVVPKPALAPAVKNE